MSITFKDLEIADKFLAEDTHFDLGIIHAKNKNKHLHVPPKQCSICKKNSQRRGDSGCDGKRRCPRCLSQSHFTPSETCIPICWTHGRGHSSESDKCLININYKRQQRKNHANQERIAQQVSTTGPQNTQFHTDILRIENQMKTQANTYATALKGIKSNISINNIAPPNIPQPANLDCTAYAAAYIAACVHEAYDPGLLQVQMDGHAALNNLPKIKLCKQSKTFLKAIAPQAPIENSEEINNPTNSTQEKIPTDPLLLSAFLVKKILEREHTASHEANIQEPVDLPLQRKTRSSSLTTLNKLPPHEIADTGFLKKKIKQKKSLLH